MNLLENLHSVITDKVSIQSTPPLKESIGDTVLNVAGDVVAAGLGMLGPVGMVPLLGMIADNVGDIKSITPQLENELETFKSNPTVEGMRKLEEYMHTISIDLLDLSSRLVQLLPDPTMTSDIAAFFAEQIIQLGFTAELPLILEKLGWLLKKVPFVGKVDVIKAMKLVGETHAILGDVEEGMASMEELT